MTLSKRTVDEVSFEYSHHKISSLQLKFTTDSLIFPKRGRFHHWREMPSRFTAAFFACSQTGSKDLPHSALTNQSKEGVFPWQPTRSTSKTVNYSKICRACNRNCHLRNSRELKKQWWQQLRKRHLKKRIHAVSHLI